MHILIFLWITFSAMPYVIKGVVEHSVENTNNHNNLLRAILWEERRFEEIEKRSHDSLMQDDEYECCPTVTRRIAPLGGLSREGKLLQLYRDYRTVQRFYQTSCKPDVLNRPCNYIEPSLLPVSRCIQKYTYMYAIVRDYNVTQPYRVDYIRVKSGCSCRVQPATPSSVESSN